MKRAFALARGASYLKLITPPVLLWWGTLSSLLHDDEGWHKFCARHADDLAATPHMLYRGKPPPSWQRIETKGPTLDTMKPIAEFSIGVGESAIRLTIHNFPIHSLSQRVAPMAQVVRWKRQFNLIDPLKTTLYPLSRGGFIGIFLESLEFPTGVLAWSMNLAEEHVLHLLQLGARDPYFAEMNADYTIKAVGPLASILQHKEDIKRFAHSFELIEEIPTR